MVGRVLDNGIKKDNVLPHLQGGYPRMEEAEVETNITRQYHRDAKGSHDRLSQYRGRE